MAPSPRPRCLKLSLSANLRVYLCTRPIDLRPGFDRLTELVRHGLTLDPRCGHLFAFKNKRGDRLKVLYWEPT